MLGDASPMLADDSRCVSPMLGDGSPMLADVANPC